MSVTPSSYKRSMYVCFFLALLFLLAEIYITTFLIPSVHLTVLTLQVGIFLLGGVLSRFAYRNNGYRLRNLDMQSKILAGLAVVLCVFLLVGTIGFVVVGRAAI